MAIAESLEDPPTVNRREIRKLVWQSWGFTLMGVLNILTMLVIAAVIIMRLRGPGAVTALIVPSIGMMVLLFTLSEALISIIFRAEVPHPENDARFIASLKRVSANAHFWFAPRARIIHLGGKPNAMAYGLPFGPLAVVAVSRELVDMLDDKELDGVVGHECGHVKSRDTFLLAFIGILVGMIQKLGDLLKAQRAAWTQAPPVALAAWLVYGIGRVAFYVSRFAISQERELAADALGSLYSGSPHALIRALEKLHAQKADSEEKQPFLHDLMVAHPGLPERVESLRRFIPATAHGEPQ